MQPQSADDYYYEQQRAPTHNHNTRYSMNVNMNRGSGGPTQPFEGLFTGGQPAKGFGRGYF